MSYNRRQFLKYLTGSSLMPVLYPAVNWSKNDNKNKPNILIYIADDQYKSSIGCYGANPSHTPNIDKLAEQGIRFTNCFTPSAICTPNRGSLLTGMYPLKHGAHANHSGFYDGVKSLPNYMKELGYRACLVGKDGIQKQSDLYDWEFYIAKSDEHVPGADEPKHERHRKSRFDEIEKFLSSDKKRPFTLVHAASLPHSPNLNKLPNGLEGYDASNYYMDYEFGRYLEILKKYNLDNNTIVIYVNDNESQQRRTKNLLYDSSLNVPMIVRWPGHIKPGSISNAVVSFIDVLPTLLTITGGQIPSTIDGKNMLDVWEGRTDHHQDEIYASYSGVIVGSERQETPFPIRAVRTHDYKYIRYPNYKVAHPKLKGEMFPFEELFDLKTDPKERKNLATVPEFLAIKKELSDKVDAWMKRNGDIGIESELATLKKYPPD